MLLLDDLQSVLIGYLCYKSKDISRIYKLYVLNEATLPFTLSLDLYHLYMFGCCTFIHVHLQSKVIWHKSTVVMTSAG